MEHLGEELHVDRADVAVSYVLDLEDEVGNVHYHCHLVLDLNASIEVYRFAIYSEKLVELLILFMSLTFYIHSDFTEKLKAYVVADGQRGDVVDRGYCHLAGHPAGKAGSLELTH